MRPPSASPRLRLLMAAPGQRPAAIRLMWRAGAGVAVRGKLTRAYSSQLAADSGVEQSAESCRQALILRAEVPIAVLAIESLHPLSGPCSFQTMGEGTH